MNKRFLLSLFVIDKEGMKMPVVMERATDDDIEQPQCWLTYQGTDYICQGDDNE